MQKRNFDNWLSGFRSSIADYSYYVDFEKVYQNIESIRVELNILNSLIGCQNIGEKFEELARKYPEILRCIPLLLAVRSREISISDTSGQFVYDFVRPNCTIQQYRIFMEKIGLFSLMQNHIIHSLVDYATGIETGLDSNARKNRGGHLMENLVESFLKKAGFVRDTEYFKEMYLHEMTDKWGIDLSAISNQGKTEKRFDFVLKTSTRLYGIETNFYASGGSKLNETARSYKQLAQEAENIPGFSFIWFTDGAGWKSARHNLEETFDVMEHLYSIADLEQNVLEKLK